MKLAIKNKWLSISGSSTVQDLDGNDVLMVEGSVFSFARKKKLMTMAKEPLYVVQNKLFSFLGRTARVYGSNGELVATVQRKLLSLKDKYFVESDLGKIEITGNILGFDYHILVDEREVGHIERKISLRDSFVLDIDDSFDYRFFVALVLAIDNVTDRRK